MEITMFCFFGKQEMFGEDPGLLDFVDLDWVQGEEVDLEDLLANTGEDYGGSFHSTFEVENAKTKTWQEVHLKVCNKF